MVLFSFLETIHFVRMDLLWHKEFQHYTLFLVDYVLHKTNTKLFSAMRQVVQVRLEYHRCNLLGLHENSLHPPLSRAFACWFLDAANSALAIRSLYK